MKALIAASALALSTGVATAQAIGHDTIAILCYVDGMCRELQHPSPPLPLEDCEALRPAREAVLPAYIMANPDLAVDLAMVAVICRPAGEGV